ncbi:allantoate amidohydrolase [Asticcacaulis sp. DXS10W]|uniref:Allantoate amidohydrolase n=1 Tax=Asticcacaulis currens TaxID=2984210 RepID=A0ABT5IF67_9CAUL|nr:allantoate amidohydrolase [Asticcacaulis currens]MDC7694837.1 allantoate amidohydrolase [Asticcacaulis currens]
MVEVGGYRAVARCDALRRPPFSEVADSLFRPYLSEAHRATLAQVREWMEAAGMAVRLDPAGNLIGRYETATIPPQLAGEGDRTTRAARDAVVGADSDVNPPPPIPAVSPLISGGMLKQKSLILASHIDSVRDAGAYDGPLGIMLAIEVVAALHAQNKRLPFAIEVYAFGDEEGSRFPASMLCSRAVCGQVARAQLDVADRDGITLARALSDFGLDIDRFTEARRDPSELIGYVEAHIEQGPVLEAEGLALGVVTAIACQRRYAVTVTGVAGHAGTNSMVLRKDALTAAAEMALAVETIGRAGLDDLVATVGRFTVAPNAPNVVPGEVVFTIDVRAGEEAPRNVAASAILSRIEAIAAARGVTVAHQLIHDLPPAPCDPSMMDLLSEAVREAGHTPRRLVSGAGHDAMVFAGVTPTAMLFIRCKDGISHNPLEAVEPADAEAAFQALYGLVLKLGEASA